VDAVGPHVDVVAAGQVALANAWWSACHCWVSRVTVAGERPAAEPSIAPSTHHPHHHAVVSTGQ
jgi:hypothetical protein